jgi:hypothetical protein
MIDWIVLIHELQELYLIGSRSLNIPELMCLHYGNYTSNQLRTGTDKRNLTV